MQDVYAGAPKQLPDRSRSTTQVWSVPALTFIAGPLSPCTSTGRGVLVPVSASGTPSCPRSLLPKHTTLPDSSSAHVWSTPAVTAVAVAMSGTRTGVALSTCSRGTPSWPWLLLPQHQMVPSVSAEQACSFPTPSERGVATLASRNEEPSERPLSARVPSSPSPVTMVGTSWPPPSAPGVCESETLSPTHADQPHTRKVALKTCRLGVRVMPFLVRETPEVMVRRIELDSQMQGRCVAPPTLARRVADHSTTWMTPCMIECAVHT